MKAKRDFLRFSAFTLNDRSQIRFWEDKWFGVTQLREQYLCLYNIARPKQITLSAALNTSPPNLPWCRDHVGSKLQHGTNYYHVLLILIWDMSLMCFTRV